MGIIYGFGKLVYRRVEGRGFLYYFLSWAFRVDYSFLLKFGRDRIVTVRDF